MRDLLEMVDLMAGTEELRRDGLTAREADALLRRVYRERYGRDPKPKERIDPEDSDEPQRRY